MEEMEGKKKVKMCNQELETTFLGGGWEEEEFLGVANFPRRVEK